MIRLEHLILMLVAAANVASGQTQIYNINNGVGVISAVDGVGDMDADGYGDFVVHHGNLSLSRVIAYSGRTGQVLQTWPDALFGNPGGLLNVVGIGDGNNDGFTDVAVGNYGASSSLCACNNGYIAVVSGSTGAVLWGAYGAANDTIGRYLSAIGDVNGDGSDDVLTSGGGGGIPGFAAVLTGTNGSLLTLVIPSAPYQGWGPVVAATSDMDGDSIPDFVARTPLPLLPLVPSGAFHSGVVRGYSGATGALLFTILPTGTSDAFGNLLAGGGDMDGDGLGDVLLSFAGPLAPLGAIASYSGATGNLIRAVVPPSGALYGGLSSLGDVNGDGRADYTFRNIPVSGAAAHFVFSGADGALLSTINYPPPGINTVNVALSSSGAAGDVFPDGAGEIIIGGSILSPSFVWNSKILVYSIASVPAAAITSIGLGCGSAIPTLAAQPAIIGTSPRISVTNASPISSGYLFLSATTSATWPIGSGCVVHLDVATATLAGTFATDSIGGWSSPASVSGAVGLVGVVGRLQAAIVPPAGGIELTNAVEFTLGF